MGWVWSEFDSRQPDFLRVLNNPFMIIENVKNFIALLVSTAVWMSGLLAICLFFLAIFTVDWLALLASLGFLAFTSLGIFIGRYNTRVKVALEIPFGIFGG